MGLLFSKGSFISFFDNRNTTATIVSDETLSSVTDEQIPVEQIPVAENPETVVQIVDKL